MFIINLRILYFSYVVLYKVRSYTRETHIQLQMILKTQIFFLIL